MYLEQSMFGTDSLLRIDVHFQQKQQYAVEIALCICILVIENIIRLGLKITTKTMQNRFFTFALSKTKMFVLRPIYIYTNKAFELMIVRDKLLWIKNNKEGERCIFSFSKSIYDEECISIYYCPLKCVLLFIVNMFQ